MDRNRSPRPDDVRRPHRVPSAVGAVLGFLLLGAARAEDSPPAKPDGGAVDEATLRAIHEQVKTPFKFGILLRGPEGDPVDCPAVFRHGGRWLMTYIRMNKVGYETLLAESDDLLDWRPLGTVMSFRKSGWDAWQGAGYPALQDHRWDGTWELQPFQDRYWMSYLGGALQGYETDPLSIGMAWTKTPDRAVEWERHPTPVLDRDQPDAREFEKVTLYKSHVIRDDDRRLGARFVLYYNGKNRENAESIGMAVSDDMIRWRRVGREPVVWNGGDKTRGISGDPQIVRIGDVFVMFYFGAFWRPGAFDTFACSRDLVRWTKWTGPDLVAPSEPWDREYAHKPWVVRHEGVVYHYYCAVGDQGRVIALATSRDLRPASKPKEEGSPR